MIRRVFRPRMTGSIQTAGYFVKTNNREMAIINPTRVNGPSSVLARTQNTLLENEIGILIILTQNSLSQTLCTELWWVTTRHVVFPETFSLSQQECFASGKTRNALLSPSSHALTNPRSDCPVGTPPQDEFKWIRKMTLLAGIVASPTMPMPPFLYYPFFAALCVTFFKFRFHFYYFLRIAPFYFLLIYIDKNNTHLMDDDFLFLFIHHSADFCSFFFTSSSSML